MTGNKKAFEFSLLGRGDRLLLGERVTESSPRVYANRKWFLRYQIDGSLGIVNLLPLLQQQQLQRHQHVEVGGVLCCDKVFWGKAITFWGISISNYVPDEAVVMLFVGVSQPFLLLVDVSKTHSTGKLSVLSVTQVLLKGIPCYGLSSCLLMKKINGERAFICSFLGVGSSTVFEVTGVGTCKLISSNNAECLSQLSTFLICLLKADYRTVEIWDCNNTIAVACSDNGEATEGY